MVAVEDIEGTEPGEHISPRIRSIPHRRSKGSIRGPRVEQLGLWLLPAS